MSQVPKRKQPGRLPATNAEHEQFAAQFIDAVLDPSRPWLVEYILKFQFPPVPSDDDIASGRLAIKIHHAIDSEKWGPWWLHEALQKRDKETLMKWAKKEATDRELTKDEMGRLLDSTKSEKLKVSLKGLRATFSFRRGPRPHMAQDEYATLSETADRLLPAVSKLLAEQASTNHTLQEILKYLQKDYPDACEYLMRYESKLEEALKDPRLHKRAEKRLKARAKVIAKAMAGCHYNYAFSTSIAKIAGPRRRPRLRS